ncbi:hypothetical protein Arub01_17650 [Actinomadura rubrobrunea]|uniref:Uncharacterized protein n=1 Tax=Actinomadura rubrobrunea TaxID=115335 RepID=A0A9W6PUM1_9ACTN|nr:hypothetical protein [Actinomadura rubrobrunea]GLW63521.1 hypothetical protein Arub01_17650 [Actinomadura rubrobrunea]
MADDNDDNNRVPDLGNLHTGNDPVPVMGYDEMLEQIVNRITRRKYAGPGEYEGTAFD